MRRLFEHDDRKGLPAEMVARIELILSTLHAAESIAAMDLPSFRLHALKGEMKGLLAVTVRANWRIVFRFADGQASDVDFVDDH